MTRIERAAVVVGAAVVGGFLGWLVSTVVGFTVAAVMCGWRP